MRGRGASGSVCKGLASYTDVLDRFWPPSQLNEFCAFPLRARRARVANRPAYLTRSYCVFVLRRNREAVRKYRARKKATLMQMEEELNELRSESTHLKLLLRSVQVSSAASAAGASAPAARQRHLRRSTLCPSGCLVVPDAAPTCPPPPPPPPGYLPQPQAPASQCLPPDCLEPGAPAVRRHPAEGGAGLPCGTQGGPAPSPPQRRTLPSAQAAGHFR